MRWSCAEAGVLAEQIAAPHADKRVQHSWYVRTRGVEQVRFWPYRVQVSLGVRRLSPDLRHTVCTHGDVSSYSAVALRHVPI